MYKTITTTASSLDNIEWSTLAPKPMIPELSNCLTIVLYKVTKSKVESVAYVVFDDEKDYHRIYFIESKYPLKGYGRKLIELVGLNIRLLPVDQEAESFFSHLLLLGVIGKLKFDRGAEDD